MARMAAFTKNVAALALVRVAGMVAALGSSVMTARLLGPEGKGILSLAILVPTLIVLCTDCGVGPATAYHTARGRYCRRMILGNTTMLSLVLGGSTVLLGLVVIVVLQEAVLSGIPKSDLLLALALMPATLLTGHLRHMFLGLERVREISLVSIAQMASHLLLLGVLLWYFETGVPGALGAKGIAASMSAVWLFGWARSILGGAVWQVDRPYLKDTTTFGMQMHITNLLQFFNYRLDLLLVNGFLGPVAVGFYTIAVGFSERLLLISHAASSMLYPRIAAEADEPTRRTFTPIISRNALWITALGTGIVYGLSHWCITVLYSTDYLPAVRPLQILLPGVVALGAARVLSQDLAGRGRPLLNSYLSGMTLVINVGLNLVLIPKHGIVGAAWATTAAYGVMWGGSVILYCAISGNSPWMVLLPQRSDWARWRQLIAGLSRQLQRQTGPTGKAARP